MAMLEIKNFNLNRFWERTPTPLKYIFAFSMIVVSSYFVFSDKIYKHQNKELTQIETNIEATYKLIDNFEKYKQLQDNYNEKIISYLQNLHSLVEELSDNTNKKFDILLNSNDKNKVDVIDKINILNESFDKLSKIYNLKGTDKLDNKLEKNSEQLDDVKYKIKVEKIK